MIILPTDTSIIRIVTSAAVTVDVHASWVDRKATSWANNGSDEIPSALNTAITTATNTIVVGSPLTGYVRNLKQLTVCNKHATSSNIVTGVHYDGTTYGQLFKFTLLAGYTLVIDDTGKWVVYDPNTGGIVAGSSNTIDPRTNSFRLTGVSATPVMVADSTALNTVYLAQYTGNRIALLDSNANWQLLSPASEPSLAVTGRTADTPFDVFAYSNAGTVTLEFLDWTNATTRATGLTRVDGIWTKAGDSTRRYMGSIRARSATTFYWWQNGVDVPARLDVFNADNRVTVWFSNTSTQNTWPYTIATVHQIAGTGTNTNYQVDVMVGLEEETFDIEVMALSSNGSAVERAVGIGYDSTTAFSGVIGVTNVTTAIAQTVGRFVNRPTIGRHYYAWLEISTASGTTTWYGDNNTPLRLQTGMFGYWTC